MRGLTELGGEVTLPGTGFSFFIKMVITTLLGVPWSILLVDAFGTEGAWANYTVIAAVLTVAVLLASRVEQYYCHALFSIGFRKLVFKIILSDQDETEFWNKAFRRELGIDIGNLVELDSEEEDS
jgi:hypothetical protein